MKVLGKNSYQIVEETSGSAKKDWNLNNRVILKDEEKPEKEVLCKVCESILDDPRECKRCNNFFCKKCTVRFKSERGGICMCGKQFSESDSPHRIIFSLLKKYKFRCVRFSHGCQAKICYENLNSHDQNCEYREIRCEYQHCQKIVYKKDYQMHFTLCEFQVVKCSYCHLQGIKKDIAQHSLTCDQRLVTCHACTDSYKNIDFPEHLRQCEEVPEECATCKVSMKRRKLKNHTEVQCINSLYLGSKTQLFSEVRNLREILKHLDQKLNEKISFFGIKCYICKKFACQVSQKNCSECSKNYCIPCSKKKIKICRECDKMICTSCSQNKDFCEICLKNKKKLKFEKRDGLWKADGPVKTFSFGRGNNNKYTEQLPKIENVE